MQKITFAGATTQTLGQPPIVLAGAPISDQDFRFEEATGRIVECDVLYPIDLKLTHGVKVTPEDIAAMAANYDPALEEAQANFDHAWGGPSEGRCLSLAVNPKNGRLRARYELSEEAIAGIRAKKWPRRSAEFTLNHPTLRKPYFRGLALLGAARPGAPGLGPWVLMSETACLIQLEEQPAAPATTETAPASTETQEEIVKKTETPASTTTATDAPPPATTPSNPAAPAAPQETTELAEKTRQLDARLAEAEVAIGKARRQSAEVEADKTIVRLGERCSPGMLKAGLRDLLVELGATNDPMTFQLSEGGKTVDKPVLEAFVAVLEKVPAFTALSAGRMAEPDGDASPDGRSSDEVQLHERHGITPERFAELKRKFPDANL